jgi:hypothetical protein
LTLSTALKLPKLFVNPRAESTAARMLTIVLS